MVVATSPQFFAAIAGWVVATSRGVPFVLEIRDLWPASIRAVGAMREGRVLRALERLELFLYRRAARIVTVTHAFRRDMTARGIDPGKIEVVPNGVDAELFSPRPRDEALARELCVAGRFVVTYVGTHGMAHGLAMLLEAAALLENERVVFVLVGSGAEKARLVERARAMKLPNVVFVDPRPRAEMPRFWSISDATVVPLRRDPVFLTTVPSKIFEAMACGVPILLGVEGEAKEVVDAAGCGIAFPPEDARALARAVKRLVDEPGLRERLRKNALAAAPRHSRSASAGRMLALLREARGRPAEDRVDAAKKSGVTR